MGAVLSISPMRVPEAWRVEVGVGQGGAWRRLRAEQAPEGEVVEEEGFGLADVVVDFGKTALDFLVRVTGIGEGVSLLLGFAEQQIEK